MPSTNIPAPPAPQKKHGWLPLLTVLFLISYALMTLLIVEQGQTIESQRALIRELFRDSVELSATKVKEQRQRMQNSATQNPSSQTQTPSTQAPAKQAPSSGAKQSQTGQDPKALPSKPAADLMDGRRVLVKI